MAKICETFATESLGNPVERAVSITLPGAAAHFVFPVSGTHTVVRSDRDPLFTKA